MLLSSLHGIFFFRNTDHVKILKKCIYYSEKTFFRPFINKKLQAPITALNSSLKALPSFSPPCVGVGVYPSITKSSLGTFHQSMPCLSLLLDTRGSLIKTAENSQFILFRIQNKINKQKNLINPLRTSSFQRPNHFSQNTPALLKRSFAQHGIYNL